MLGYLLGTWYLGRIQSSDWWKAQCPTTAYDDAAYVKAVTDKKLDNSIVAFSATNIAVILKRNAKTGTDYGPG